MKKLIFPFSLLALLIVLFFSISYWKNIKQDNVQDSEENLTRFHFAYDAKNIEDKILLSSPNVFVSTCRRFPVYQPLLADLENLWVVVNIDSPDMDRSGKLSIFSIKKYDNSKYYWMFHNLCRDLENECSYIISKRDIFSKNREKVLVSLLELTCLSEIYGESIYPTNIYIESALEIAIKNDDTEVIEILEKRKKRYSYADILNLKKRWYRQELDDMMTAAEKDPPASYIID